MAKISIIVPVYNVENYLSKCLDSLINQTFQDIEIICINDGSTDNSLNILQEYASKDKRIKVFNQENSGVAKTRNKGLEVANGEYIGFCDSDDWAELDFYEKLYNTATKHQADIAVTNIIKVKKNKLKSFFSVKNTVTTEDYYKKLKLCNIPDLSYLTNKIYKTSEIRKNNLTFENFAVYEDAVFSIQALYYLKKLVTVTDTNYYYLHRKSSLLHSKNNSTDQTNSDNFIKEFLAARNIPAEKVMTITKTYRIFNFLTIKVKTKDNKTKIQIFIS